jgi:hypothetical protein
MSLAIAISGCSKPKEEDEYFPPPRDGSKKEYTFEMSDIHFPGVIQKGRIASKYDGTETINGKIYFKEVIAYSGIPGMPAQIHYIKRDKDGMHAIDGDDNTKTEYLVTPFPVKVGNSWTVKTTKGETHYKADVIETLQLFDRKYDRCLKISWENSDGHGYVYRAPRIGQVKAVYGYENGKTIDVVLDKQ